MVQELHCTPTVNHVLVAETDHLIHYALSKTLQSCDSEIKSVSNGDDAVTEISSFFYPLCIFDDSTPGINSAQLKKMKETSPNTQIIMIMEGANAHSDVRNVKEDKIEEGLCYCLIKPFEISELKAMVRRILNKDEEKSFPFKRSEPRRCVRKPVNYTVTVVELGRPTSLTLNGQVVDICGKGMGLRTHYPLHPGHLLMFNHGIEEKAGVVRWSSALDETCTYRVGIEFLDKW